MNIQGTFYHLVVVTGVGVLMASCASEQTVTEGGRVRKDPWGNELPFKVGKDEDGNPMMKSDKRSQFENKSSNIATNRDFSGKDYTKRSYRKKRWGGDTAFNPKKFDGNTDASRYKKEPWFVKKQVKGMGGQARDNNKNFAVNPFRSQKSSYQHGGHAIPMPDNSLIREKRNSFGQPDITDWKSQKGLTVKDTNGMLGR